ncbi:MAG: hypothetical protein AB1330_01555 [Bacillota bacterium]
MPKIRGYRAMRSCVTTRGAMLSTVLPAWSRPPVSYEEAEKLLTQLKARPLDEMQKSAEYCLAGDIKSVEYRIVEAEYEVGYDDNRLRTVTVDGKRYRWRSDGEFVYVYEGSRLVLQYAGDPHDRSYSGVRTAIRESLVGCGKEVGGGYLVEFCLL